MVNAIPERNLPVLNFGRFPFNQNVRFVFFGNFQYQNNLRKQLTKIFEIFSRKFFIYELSLLEFLELSVEWLAFRKFNSFQNFWKLFREISVPFAVSSKGGFIIAIAFACWNLLLFLGSKTIKNFSRQIFESLG